MRKDCWTSTPTPFIQRLLLTASGFALLWSHHYLAYVLSELLEGRGPAHFLCLWLESLSWFNCPKWAGPGSRVPIVCPTFCLSTQEPRQAWRIASGTVCSLLFPARVVTNMQRWHWESCGSHSPGRDPRVVRPRQGTVKAALQR